MKYKIYNFSHVWFVGFEIYKEYQIVLAREALTPYFLKHSFLNNLFVLRFFFKHDDNYLQEFKIVRKY